MAKQIKTAKAPVAAPSKGAPPKKASAKTSVSDSYGNAGDKSLLEEYVVDSLKDIYWAEKHLVKFLPKMNKAATSTQLKDSFTEHLTVTQGHVDRLDQVFQLMGKKAQAKKCDAMEGITKEALGIIDETEKGTLTRDVALIMAAQKVEHYEIATYGALVQIAKTMGKNDVADILAQTLGEEKDCDQKLTDIAENDINMQAEGETADEA